VSRRGPLGRTQYSEWWGSQCMPDRAHANVFVEIKCPEGVTPQAVDRAARLVLSRHEAFRTTFGLDAAGTPEQLIHPVSDLPPIAHVVLERPDGRAQAVRELTSHEFDISAEMPVKAIIISFKAGQANFLLICCPHLACDYHSMLIIQAEILTLLANPGPEENPALPNCGPQPLDIALEEALSYSTRSDAVAARYWAKALSAAPLRNFWRSYNIDTEMYQARAASHDAPVLLSRYALAHGSTPSVIYTALVHVMISLISNRASTLVRFYFAGRPRRFENSVGPFNRELFSTVEISDSDTVSACVRKAAVAIMNAQVRYSLDYLSFREAEIKEESRRGSAFAWGTVVNFVDTPEFRSRWRELPYAPASAQGGDLPYSVTPSGPDVNELGLEVFLRAAIEPTCMSVTAEFNSAAFRPEDAEILVRGPWDIIRNSLATGEDTEIADLRRRYGFAPARPEEERAAHALGLRDAGAVLERFPGVTASFLAVRSDRSPTEVVAYVAVDGHEIATTDLRDHVLAALKPSAAVICPDYFIICEAVPGDRTSETSWRTVRRLSEGTGISPCRFLGHTAQETTLLQALREVSDGASADLAKSYVEGGGTLLKVPAVLQFLARAGFTGLHAKNFDGHARLYQLARRLSLDPPPK
jgi:hypothetical protein